MSTNNNNSERIAPQTVRTEDERTQAISAPEKTQAGEAQAKRASAAVSGSGSQSSQGSKKPAIIAGIIVAVVAIALVVVLACTGVFADSDATGASGSGAAHSEQSATQAQTQTSANGTSDANSESSISDSNDKDGTLVNSENAITVTIAIDGSAAGDQDTASMNERSITLEKGATVYDALKSLGVNISGSGYYVKSISGLAEKQLGALSGWQYMVDGSYPGKSCGNYVLKGGENIVWKYVLETEY